MYVDWVGVTVTFRSKLTGIHSKSSICEYRFFCYYYFTHFSLKLVGSWVKICIGCSFNKRRTIRQVLSYETAPGKRRFKRLRQVRSGHSRAVMAHVGNPKGTEKNWKTLICPERRTKQWKKGKAMFFYISSWHLKSLNEFRFFKVIKVKTN